jgi:hypothetical protein
MLIAMLEVDLMVVATSFADAHPCGATLAWHQRIESTVRYLGVEVEDALEIAEKTDV